MRKYGRRAYDRGLGNLATVAAPPAPVRTAGENSDHDLVAFVRSGDDRAFEALYQRYHRRIASYIYGMVSDYGRAEDIAQDVFMSALRRMRETDRPIAFKPWIYEIAKNACIDQFRRSRRAEEVSYDADEGLGAADYGRLVTTGPTPDVAVDQKMSLDHLRGAFGGLSETHHEILVMRELEGLSYREIGDRLGMSRPSVESTLFRARRRLTEEYEELITGERCIKVQAIIAGAQDGALGARDQRKLARHISYCQPCRRHARMAGLDTDALVMKPPVGARVAALLPLPAFLKRRFNDTEGVSSLAGSNATHVANWSAAVTTYAEPSLAGWAKAAAAAVSVAVAGMGAGVATQQGDLTFDAKLPDSPLVRHAGADAATRAVKPAVGGLKPVVTRGAGTRSTLSRSTATGGGATDGAAPQAPTPEAPQPPVVPDPRQLFAPPSSPTPPEDPSNGSKERVLEEVGKVAPVTPSPESGATAPLTTGESTVAGAVSTAVGEVDKLLNDGDGDGGGGG